MNLSDLGTQEPLEEPRTRTCTALKTNLIVHGGGGRRRDWNSPGGPKEITCDLCPYRTGASVPPTLSLGFSLNLRLEGDWRSRKTGK